MLVQTCGECGWRRLSSRAPRDIARGGFWQMSWEVTSDQTARNNQQEKMLAKLGLH